MGLKKIINSGQRGAEQGALASAFKHDCPTGGFIPEGYKVGKSKDESLKVFNLTPVKDKKIAECVLENMNIADGTILFLRNPDKISKPEQFALQSCEVIRKPYLVFTLDGSMSVASIRAFLSDHNISYLHITGGQDGPRTDYIFKFVFRTVDTLLETLITETKYDKKRDNFVTANKD